MQFMYTVWREKLVNHLLFVQLKSFKFVLTVKNLVADLFIHQTLIVLTSAWKKGKFAKHSPTKLSCYIVPTSMVTPMQYIYS